MRVVVAMDSFKGSLDARAACEAAARGIRAARPDAVVESCPMADGGEGTAAVIESAVGGAWVELEVTGPLPERRVRARYLWVPGWGPGALIELAAAAGIERLGPGERDPMRATTRGVGELIVDALARGARTVRLAVGGSATVDGGVGMARALGWRFEDADGAPLAEGGGALGRLARITAPGGPPGLGDAEIEVWCDVDSPLVGPAGAAAVFAPQKGATPDQVRTLAAGLERLARMIATGQGQGVGSLAGGGAAGGAAAGAAAFFGARLVPGVAAVIEAVGLGARLEGADHLLTGEGRLDEQTLAGKVVAGVAARARARGVPVTVIAGAVTLAPARQLEAGIGTTLSLPPTAPGEIPRGAEAARRIEAAARRWATALPRG